ncbi:MAG: hypothetical protein NVS2B7_05460 [Herpetosiphon sp.]
MRGERVFSNSTQASSQVLHASLLERGVEIYYHATAAHYDDSSQRLTVKMAHTMVDLDAVDKVLIAMGRTRSIDNLGLEHTGMLHHTQNGIEVDSFGQTTVAGIFAIGDVTPTSHWTHSANA